MKKQYKTSSLIFALSFIAFCAIAQDPGPGPDPGGDPDVPIDGGIAI